MILNGLLKITLVFFIAAHHFANAKVNESTEPLDSSVEWALNVGGGNYTGADGIAYQADTSIQDESIVGAIKGAQDGTVFKTYKVGLNKIHHQVANGHYDLIFKFAEPEKKSAGERVFNVVAEGQTVIPNLDVVLARDGNEKSSLVRMVSNVKVADGVLDIELESITGKPILNALVVRRKALVNDGWVLIWEDNFNYQGAPNPAKWNHDIWPAKKVNDEDQAYTNRLKNVRVENGMLTIEAHREDYENAQYTSGRVHAADKGDLLYGRIEVRAKLPSGQGTWPAIWMLPSDPFRYATKCSKGEDWQGNPNCDAWPNSGEIDIMEHVGYDMNRVHGTVHNRAYYWVNGEQRKSSVEAHNVDQEFHVYSMEWSPERIDVYYDNALYFTYLNQGEGWQAWPYDHPFHLIMNVAIGGGWGSAGGPTDDTVFPTKMQVDYVKMYQKANVTTASVPKNNKKTNNNKSK